MRPPCDAFQEHLSAVHDGEHGLFDDVGVVRAHTDGCRDCTAYEAGLARLDRAAAAVVARPVVDGTAAVLSAAPTLRQPRADLGRLRGLLGVAAGVQAVLAVLVLFDASGAVGHTARDLVVYELAAAAGLAAAALRPPLAQGLLPMVGLAAAAGVVLSAVAIAGGASLGQEVSHLVLAVACWPLVVLARATGAPGAAVTA